MVIRLKNNYNLSINIRNAGKFNGTPSEFVDGSKGVRLTYENGLIVTIHVDGNNIDIRSSHRLILVDENSLTFDVDMNTKNPK
ncbi:hypothetical protein [Staphylococcus simulans]|uniref:hypothetical protein n=1 Tax=Staphylococcus simulans TaxID=1286 RepID=UPI002174E195|nr:hypothetical protein [Staphylococcus simulans]